LCNSLIYIIMKTIRNNQLFEELQTASRDDDTLWGVLFEESEDGPYCRDPEIPVLAGGLDHVEVTKNGVYYYDIGCNGEDNSFVVRRELSAEKKKTSFHYYCKGVFLIPADDPYYNDWKRALNLWHYPGVYDTGGFVKWICEYPELIGCRDEDVKYDMARMESLVSMEMAPIVFIKDLRVADDIYRHRRHLPVGPPRYVTYACVSTFRK